MNMCASYKLRKGLNIHLQGEAVMMTAPPVPSPLYELKPSDCKNLTPKLLVKEGDTVQAGTPVYSHKDHPQMLFTSPVSGTVHQIVRGEKRKVTGIRIRPDGRNAGIRFTAGAPEDLPSERVRELLLQSGCWPLIIRRPYGIPAYPAETPRAVYISCFDSAPQAPR